MTQQCINFIVRVCYSCEKDNREELTDLSFSLLNRLETIVELGRQDGLLSFDGHEATWCDVLYSPTFDSQNT